MNEPQLESLTLVLLKRPPDAPDYPEERLDEIQAQRFERGDSRSMSSPGGSPSGRSSTTRAA